MTDLDGDAWQSLRDILPGAVQRYADAFQTHGRSEDDLFGYAFWETLYGPMGEDPEGNAWWTGQFYWDDYD